MLVNQISVFLENRSGRIAEFSSEEFQKKTRAIQMGIILLQLIW